MSLTSEEIRAINNAIGYHEWVIRENLSKIRKLSDEIGESKIFLRLAKDLKERNENA